MLPLTALDRIERKRGRQEGLQEGIQQGQLKGMRRLVEGQLVHQFGSLDGPMRDRLTMLDEDGLRSLLQRMMGDRSSTLDELLKEDAGS